MIRRLIRLHNAIPFMRWVFTALLVVWIVVWLVEKVPFLIGLWVSIALAVTVVLLNILRRQAMRLIINDVQRAAQRDIDLMQQYYREHNQERDE